MQPQQLTAQQVISSSPSVPAPLSAKKPTAAVAPVPAVSTPAVPPLTDQQKKILHEFKQKMAKLPPDQQNAYMTANKATLFRQLNFQPSQLEQLKNNHLQTRGVLQQTPPAASSPLLTASPQPFSTSGGGIVSTTPVAVDASNSLKRPLSAADSKTPAAGTSSVPLVKQKRIVWVESQIKKDQNEAVNPNYNAPFKGPEDACKRLLRYHVFNEIDTSPDEMEKAEDAFETKSCSLLAKKDVMLKKYHFLLAIESTRPNASSEEVMLARLWDTDERQALAREKEEVTSGRSTLNLPPLPKKWAEQLGVDENIGQGAAQEVADVIVTEAVVEKTKDEPEEVHKEEDDLTKVEDVEDKHHFGLKFSRTHSGRWGVDAEEAAKDDEEGEEDYDEFQSIKNELNGFKGKEEPSSAALKAFGSDDEAEEFNLQDVDAAEAVGSIIADMEDEGMEAAADEGDADAAAAAESSAVQSAINSILGDQERMETPDFAGLLDSIDEEDDMLERDPITEAAVSNIPRF
jgi:hypothetical protein